jgi:hypothetical protein
MKKRRTLAAQPDGLAHRIASVRKGLGLSQGAFGEAVGSPGTPWVVRVLGAKRN